MYALYRPYSSVYRQENQNNCFHQLSLLLIPISSPLICNNTPSLSTFLSQGMCKVWKLCDHEGSVLSGSFFRRKVLPSEIKFLPACFGRNYLNAWELNQPSVQPIILNLTAKLGESIYVQRIISDALYILGFIGFLWQSGGTTLRQQCLQNVSLSSTLWVPSSKFSYSVA